MSDEEKKENLSQENPVGRLMGKTTTYEVTMQVTDPNVLRNTYLKIYGEKDKEGKRPHYLLSIADMYSDSSGMVASLMVLGDRPKRPFEVGAEVYKSKQDQID